MRLIKLCAHVQAYSIFHELDLYLYLAALSQVPIIVLSIYVCVTANTFRLQVRVLVLCGFITTYILAIKPNAIPRSKLLTSLC